MRRLCKPCRSAAMNFSPETARGSCHEKCREISGEISGEFLLFLFPQERSSKVPRNFHDNRHFSPDALQLQMPNFMLCFFIIFILQTFVPDVRPNIANRSEDAYFSLWKIAKKNRNRLRFFVARKSQGFFGGKGTFGDQKIAAIFAFASENRNRNRRKIATLGADQESEVDPWPRYFSKKRDTAPISIAMLLQKYALPLAESSLYTTNLYHDTPPICIVMLLQKYSGLSGRPVRVFQSRYAIAIVYRLMFFHVSQAIPLPRPPKLGYRRIMLESCC